MQEKFMRALTNAETTNDRKRTMILRRPAITSCLLLAIALFLPSRYTLTEAAAEKTFVFASPGEAVLALYNAVKSGDSQTVASIFGSHTDDIVHTGDSVADKNMAAAFIKRYEEMHRVVLEPDQTVTLYVGADNWPFPIPIEKNADGNWYFNTDAGVQEILYRRVGANENDAIEILNTLVGAQREYASVSHDGNPTGQYAQRFLSDQGKQNGLFWKTSDGETPSPIGPLLAGASSEGYSAKQGDKPPFHGYYFQMLTKQGPTAKGGSVDYMSGGKLTRGFAFIAYPAQYANSGVMTFIVNKSGVVYQKDLGDKTAELAPAIQAYDPDKTWEPVE
jgi:hypothetical protein